VNATSQRPAHPLVPNCRAHSGRTAIRAHSLRAGGRAVALVGACLVVACILTGCVQDDPTGAPPAGGAASQIDATLLAFDKPDARRLQALYPQTSRADLDSVVTDCSGIAPANRSKVVEQENGPMTAMVSVYGWSRDSRKRPLSCTFDIYWQQDSRTWTIGIIPSSTPSPPSPGSASN
jgi:hypothetical protein